MKEIIELVAPKDAVKAAVFMTVNGELVVAEKWFSPAGTSDHVSCRSKGCRYEATRAAL